MKLWLAPNGLHIECGEVCDAKEIAKLHAKAFYRGWSVAEFEGFLADKTRTPTFVVSDKKKSIAGFAIIRQIGEEAELLSIVVAKNKRSKGVGSALLRAILDDLLNTPVESFFLEVDEKNHAAIKLYKKFGFVEIAKRSGYYRDKNGEKSTALVMSLQLE